MPKPNGQPQPHFVLVHGGFHGGWCWRHVVRLLREQGHSVSTPTQTGLGERSHLLSAEIDLDVFIDDVVQHIVNEEWQNVVLVGHSFGGCAISGAAERIPGRIRHLVYLDALIVPPGRRAFDAYEPEVVAKRRALVQSHGGGVALPVPPVTSFGIPDDHPDADWVRRRLVPHPVGTFESTFNIAGPIGNGLPASYVVCTDPLYSALEPSRRWVKDNTDWNWIEVATGHDIMITAPERLAEILVGL